MKKAIILFIFLSNLFASYAQTDDAEPRPYINKHFCIILSTKSYTEANKIAIQASKLFKIKLDYRDLLPNKKIGLTLSKTDCEAQSWEFPAYYSRGRDDDGEYISIEYSNAFSGYTKGYYIVVVASGNKMETNKTLIKVKKKYKTAYVKQSEVYVGCMH